MSIIEKAAEKAAGKLGQAEKNAKAPALSIIERAARKAEKEDIANIVQAKTLTEPDRKSGIAESETDPSPLHGATPQSNLATIDLARLRQLGGVTPNEEKTQIAEEFRLIKRPLITNAFNQGAGKINNGNLIMVTSALAGEGKTFCAINLAMSIAMEMDHTVLLVDADVARPSIPKYLGLKAGRGLLDVLLDDRIELADVMMRTNVEKLSILTAGKKSVHATELLASQSMSDLLTDIAQRYPDRIVIFDSPPLLLTTEAQVLATQMGQIVMVVEAETTPQQTVVEALRQIESCDVINLIYNKARAFSGGGYYGYNYD
ncbi:MAG: tyrosine-protein kinase family protein [Gallionella sp.]|nr:MAG: tyrosine-protein kinase family protein [Gallionella sp.]